MNIVARISIDGLAVHGQVANLLDPEASGGSHYGC